MTTQLALVGLDANWDVTWELLRAVSDAVPVLAIDVREVSQAVRSGRSPCWQGETEQAGPQLWLHRLTFPPGWFYRAQRIFMPVLARKVRWLLDELFGNGQVVWFVTSPYYLPALRVADAGRCVYRVLDDYRFYWPHRARITDKYEKAMIERADLVLCVSRYLQAKLRVACPEYAERIGYLPNGVPDLFFEQPAPDLAVEAGRLLAQFRRPIFLYAGDPRQRADPAMLRALKEADLGSLVIAGPGGPRVDVAPGLTLPSLGRLRKRVLAGVYRAVDVLVIPQVDTEFNRAACPRKLWEYMASGTPVVGSCLTELDGDSSGVPVVSSPGEFVNAVAAIVRDGDGEQDRRARLAAAERHRYHRLATRLLGLLVRTGGRYPKCE